MTTAQSFVYKMANKEAICLLYDVEWSRLVVESKYVQIHDVSIRRNDTKLKEIFQRPAREALCGSTPDADQGAHCGEMLLSSYVTVLMT